MQGFGTFVLNLEYFEQVQHMVFLMEKPITEQSIGFILSDENMKCLEEFTCNFNSLKPSTNSINDLIYNSFCSKQEEIESHQLPPCLDSLKKHAQRANYQSAIWKRSLESHPDTPTPKGRGWKLIVIDGKEQL